MFDRFVRSIQGTTLRAAIAFFGVSLASLLYALIVTALNVGRFPTKGEWFVIGPFVAAIALLSAALVVIWRIAPLIAIVQTANWLAEQSPTAVSPDAQTNAAQTNVSPVPPAIVPVLTQRPSRLPANAQARGAFTR